MNKVYEGPQDCPEIIPVFPLARVLLLPRGQMPLNIFEPRYLAMVDFALGGDRVIGMIQPDNDADPESEAPKLARVGCAGRIVQFFEAWGPTDPATLAGRRRLSSILFASAPPKGE